MIRFRNYEELFRQAQHGKPVRISVAAAHDEVILRTVQKAIQMGLIQPYLVGNEPEIRNLAAKIKLDLTQIPIFHAASEEESAYIAARLANEGITQAIMKGLINSTPFLKGVLHKDFQLRTGRLLSHMAAFEIPGFDHLYFIADSGLNIAPDLAQKEQILQNSIEFLHQIGLRKPKIALLAANERVNEKMPITIECKTLADRSKDGRYGTAVIEGPLPLDLAISKRSVAHKGIQSGINGDADLLFVPNLETGNIFAKSITYFAKGVMAGIVLGAKVPLMLNSRSDSVEAKLASIALSVVAVRAKEELHV